MSDDEEKIIAEEIKLLEDLAILDAREHLAQFITYTKEDYDLKWFHELICETLTKFVKGTLIDENGKPYQKLMIFVPPQHGKSQISSRHLPAFSLGLNPKEKIALCSYSSDLAAGFNRNVQQIIDTPEYARLFPETRLLGKSIYNDMAVGDMGRKILRNSDIFEIVKHRGFLKAVGVGSALTGTPVDFGIIDDPYKDRKEARSPVIRQNVLEWYDDVFLTRLHNLSKILMLFTRWHEDDLAGTILKREAKDWYVLAIPALKEAVKPLKEAVDIDDPRQIDEALWPEKHSAERIIQKREATPTTFNSLYQQRPSAAEGNSIKKAWFEIIEGLKLDGYKHEIYIDGAYTKNTNNDPTAITFVLVPRDKSFLVVNNSVTVHLELYELLEFLPKFCEANGFDKSKGKVFIEPKASGKSLKSMLQKLKFNAIEIRNKTVALGKESRVEDAAPSMQAGKVKLLKGAWNEKLLDELGSFPNATHDDQVDNICYAVHEHYINKEKRGMKKRNVEEPFYGQ